MEGSALSTEWHVRWVTNESPITVSDHPILQRWADLGDREAALRIDPGDPILVDPDSRVDPRLTLYATRSAYARLAASTRKNYASDSCLFFNFLWQRGKNWDEATGEDLLDFEDWRRWTPRNPQRIGGSKWNRELAALRRLYKWAVAKRYMAASPVAEREVMGRNGQMVSVPVARAKDARASNVKWLTPRAYRMWRDVGLRGYTPEGRRDPSFRGRNDDRNAAYSDVLFSSGMRRTEGGSLLTIEIPDLVDASRNFYDGKLGKETTKSKRERTFWVSADALRSVETYVRTSRRAAVRRAQAQGRYEAVRDMWIVTGRSGFEQRDLHLVDETGEVFERNLTTLEVEERQRLFIEGEGGLEPLWLWLSEDGRPFLPHSWEAVYRAASERCRVLLEGKVSKPPHFTPHMARHSFALYMLVALQHVLDNRFGLTAEERKDLRLLYGDSWRLVKNLLDHASEETTRAIYLAPVSDIQVRSLLLEDAEASVTELLSQIAEQSERVMDEVAV